MISNKKNKIIDLPPYAPTLIESTRAIGYSLEAAIADIVDNSIAANATQIDVFFFPIDDEYIAIVDNGDGMGDEAITVAMQYGSKNPKEIRAENDLGRFGLGLKTASLSQCKELTVVSKQNGCLVGRRWDIDFVAREKKWSLLILDNDEINSLPHIDKLMKYDTGTLVLWSNLDRLKLGEIRFEQAMGRRFDDVRKHLQLVYHRYLTFERGYNKVDIRMNSNPVIPSDPFLEDKSTRVMDDEVLIIRNETIKVRAYMLPHPSKLSQEEIDALGGADGLRRSQGFYIYRNRRLLVWGTWFRMMRQGDMSKLIRIRVDIPNALDELWTLDIKKSTAIPPAEIRDNLKSIIERLAEKSKRTWVYRGKKETSEEVGHVWNVLRTRTGGRVYEINRNNPIYESIIESAPGLKPRIESFLKQIELGLPINSLYIDFSNEVSIDNEKEIELSSVFELAKGMLSGMPKEKQEILLKSLILNEPFEAHKDEILKAFNEGKLS